MKKTIRFFALALALMTVAFAGGPVRNAEAICQRPACFASPGCCFNWQCDSFCGGRGLGLCGGECCECQG